MSIGCDLTWLYDKDEAKVARVQELKSRFPDDTIIYSQDGNPIQPKVNKNGITRWVDEWGTGWEDDGYGAKTESYPLEDGYHLLDSYTFPDPHDPKRFSAADLELPKAGERYIKGTVWFTLFERLWMLRGFNNMLMDPYVDEANFCRMRDRVLDINLSLIDHWIERKVHGVFFSDDWGCQRGLLMNPDDWRKYYKPAYAAMFSKVRAANAHVWMHLCGDVSEIIGDLIDCGLNVINPIQPQAMDVRRLSRDFGGKVCFWGGVDVQGTLIRGSQEDVKHEIRNLVDLFGKFDGGYIGGTSHSVMPETPLDNVIAMYEAFLEYL